MMTNSFVCPVSGETPDEERINHITHLIGLGLSVLAWVYLMLQAAYSQNVWNIVSSFVYATSLVFMYAASTYYHGCKRVGRKYSFKIMDHIAIYLLIAGSYTPYTLGPLRSTYGWDLLYTVWGIAFLGIALKIVAIHRFKLFSLLSYLAMGWLVVFSFPALSQNLSFLALFWIALGGLFYTVGTLFYAWESLPYNHAIWHLFVLGGSAAHYCSILCVMQGTW